MSFLDMLRRAIPAKTEVVMDVRSELTKLLRAEEGERLKVYDDATGLPIGPGSAVKGHPTIGVGRALDTNGLDAQESAYLLAADADRVLGKLSPAITGWATLAPARQVVLAAMAFQMGVPGLLAFKATLAAVSRGDYAAAATQMLESKWAQQTPARAQRMAAIMRTGALS